MKKLDCHCETVHMLSAASGLASNALEMNPRAIQAQTLEWEATMLNKTILAIALTLTLAAASNAFAAAKQHSPVQNDNQTYSGPTDDDARFDRATGSIY
jgi:hypothetical protein